MWPSLHLVRTGFVDKLFRFLKEDHLAEVSRTFLDYLPTETSLVELSARPSDFCDLLANSSELKYFFTVLKWRLTCSYYRDLYQRSILPRVLVKLLRAKITKSIPDIVSYLIEFQVPFSSELAPAMFDLLADKQLSDDTKQSMSDYLWRFGEDSFSISEFIPSIEKAILGMSEHVWKTFSKYLFTSCNEAKLLFDIAVAHPNNSICRQIFKRFLTEAVSSQSP
jgi:hypothetical protein